MVLCKPEELCYTLSPPREQLFRLFPVARGRAFDLLIMALVRIHPEPAHQLLSEFSKIHVEFSAFRPRRGPL